MGAPGGNGQRFRGAGRYWRWELQEDSSCGGHFVGNCRGLEESIGGQKERGCKAKGGQRGAGLSHVKPLLPTGLEGLVPSRYSKAWR